MKLRMLGLLGALVFAAPVAAIAAPANGLTAQTSAPAAVAPVETDAAVAPGTTAKVEKVWWRGGYGWRGGRGWRGGYGWRGGWRGGYGYGRGYGWRGYGWRRRFY